MEKNHQWQIGIIIQNGYWILHYPTGIIKTTLYSLAIQEEVSPLLQKQAIVIVPSSSSSQERFYSRYFTVPRKDGGLRPILDLRNLNTFIQPQQFCMLNLDTIIPLLSWGDWFIVIALQDAYFRYQFTHSIKNFSDSDSTGHHTSFAPSLSDYPWHQEHSQNVWHWLQLIFDFKE